jgi:beta-galactosidase
MLQKFSDKALPPVPAMYPVISFPKIELTEFAPMAYGCGGLCTTENSDNLTFEYNNLGWGSMYYITRLPEVPVPSTLTLDAHDYAQVFINDRFVGRLDRRVRETTLTLPPTRRGDVLRILVEATGRINYGRAIKDFKGIVGDVTLHYADETVTLSGWERYPIPDDYEQAIRALDGFSGKRVDEYHEGFADEVKIFGTRGYYRGTFSVSAAGDTWLDMSSWGKGQVYVNGHALGRFWEIGPQQTLYVPGCWLKRGQNEIVVLDVIGPQASVIEGLDHPILDNLRQPTPVIVPQEGETWQGDGPGAVWQGDGPGAM